MAKYELNKRAVAHARDLIAKRQYVVKSTWGDVQPSADDENAFLDESDDLCCCRLLDFLQLEAASHLPKSHIPIGNCYTTRKMFVHKFLIFKAVARVESIQQGLCLIAGNCIRKLCLCFASGNDK